jgi:hypothetical protein
MSKKRTGHLLSLVALVVLGLLAFGCSGEPSSREEPTAQERAAKEARRAERARVVQVKQDAFKKWALENTAVTDISFSGEHRMLVTLSPDKYTNRDNVRVIAEKLAQAGAFQMGLEMCTCKVYLGQEEYATGRYVRP